MNTAFLFSKSPISQEIRRSQEEAYRHPKLYDEKNPRIDRVGLQGDAMTVEICTDNPRIDEDIQLVSQALSRDDELLSERLHLLADLLRDMGYGRG